MQTAKERQRFVNVVLVDAQDSQSSERFVRQHDRARMSAVGIPVHDVLKQRLRLAVAPGEIGVAAAMQNRLGAPGAIGKLPLLAREHLDRIGVVVCVPRIHRRAERPQHRIAPDKRRYGRWRQADAAKLRGIRHRQIERRMQDAA
ncbi:hypothetical protein U14_05528 [Candidatus Moduliflexus flocculans]|uniref:Uncharacterized protein n=1 Tax=Candidatus Moduliflexus flocculans TaxID=1499966 RepID=A0A081BS68_9BACT|nr:hypothetical protein U14_05528 [Candidatus Moduliflexus flocculans]